MQASQAAAPGLLAALLLLTLGWGACGVVLMPTTKISWWWCSGMLQWQRCGMQHMHGDLGCQGLLPRLGELPW